MQVKLRRAIHPHSLIKFYAKVEKECGAKAHRVVRIRTSRMKRWLCDCDDFLFRKAPRNRHCSHIQATKRKMRQQFHLKESSL
jgi:hypothetical protein